MTETSAAPNIFTAINKVMEAVGYVKKQRTQGLNYSFAGEAALIAALRPEMVENGIFVYVEDVQNVESREYESRNGANMINVSLTARIKFVHAPSGTSITVTARGEGSDSGDKANNKAMTAAYKYGLRQTFCIETGDDPDNFQPTRKEHQTENTQPTAPKNGKPVEPEAPTTPAEPTNGNHSLEWANALLAPVGSKKGTQLGLLNLGEIKMMRASLEATGKKAALTADQSDAFEGCGIIITHREK